MTFDQVHIWCTSQWIAKVGIGLIIWVVFPFCHIFRFDYANWDIGGTGQKYGKWPYLGLLHPRNFTKKGLKLCTRSFTNFRNGFYRSWNCWWDAIHFESCSTRVFCPPAEPQKWPTVKGRRQGRRKRGRKIIRYKYSKGHFRVSTGGGKTRVAQLSKCIASH